MDTCISWFTTQRVPVKLNSGSGFTWVHGQNIEKPESPNAFHSSLSTCWKPQGLSATLPYLDSRVCIAEVGYEEIAFTPNGTRFEILMGVDQTGNCDSFTYGTLGLDKMSNLLGTLTIAKGTYLPFLDWFLLMPRQKTVKIGFSWEDMQGWIRRTLRGCLMLWTQRTSLSKEPTKTCCTGTDGIISQRTSYRSRHGR